MIRFLTLRRVRWPRLALLGCLLPALLLSSCTRRYYRKEADQDVGHVLSSKDDPRWSLEDYQVIPHDQSRFADPSDPDHPPMPPDDPAAKATAPNPQKPYHKGGCGLIEGVGYIDLLEQWDRSNREELKRRQQARTQAAAGDPAAKNDRPKNGKPEKLGAPDSEPRPEKLPLPKDKGAANDAPEANNRKPKKGDKSANDEPIPADEKTSPEKMQKEAEERVRRELADVVTLSGDVSADEASKAVSKERTFLITLEQSVELGLINSREYQNRREAVYLAALPVTVERFAFCAQPFAAFEIARERFGRKSPDGFANRWRADSIIGFSKLFSTGGLLLASFANRTIWGLAGDPSSSVSHISLDLIQPLLRGAGKAVTLEPLTQAERNLLYVIRDYARFRQEFYAFIAAGQANFIPGVQAGVQALTPGSVTLPGVFIPGATPLATPTTAPSILAQVPPGSSGIALRPVLNATAPPQGYLSTLGEKAVLVNQYRNIQSLQRFLELFRVYLEGGIVNSVQVGQVEQQLLRSIENVLSLQAGYRNDMDQFKLQLGLPMDIRIEVDDEPLEPMFGQTRRFEDVSVQFERISNQAQQYARPSEATQLRGRLRALLLTSPLVRGTKFPARLRKSWSRWEKLEGNPQIEPGDSPLERELDKLTKERRVLLDKRDRLKDDEKEDLPEKEKARLEELDFEVELGRFERALRVYAGTSWTQERDKLRRLEQERDALMKKREKMELTAKETQRLAVLDAEVDLARRRVALPQILFQVVLREFLALLEEPFRERLEDVRKRWPDLPPLCLEGVDLLRDDDDVVLAAASRAALENRLDLMNQRAELVDSWRKIRVAANALLGTFNVTYSLDAFTPAGELRPLQFGGSRMQNRLIFNAELPLVRIQERNAYRATLISFQRQRRELQQAEDQVLFAVRLDLRQLRAAANNYHKVQKRQVELAYQQVDQSLQAFSQPQTPSGPPPTAVGSPAGGGSTGDPAALTNQLLTAQNALLQAQNDLYNTWINYLTTRINLYRDMGLMPLDPRGVWIDDPARCCPPQPADGRKPDPEAPAAPAKPAGPDRLDDGWSGAGADSGAGRRLRDGNLEPVGQLGAGRPDPAPGKVRTITIDHYGARPTGGGGKQ
jgi:outer membrane protein TolC